MTTAGKRPANAGAQRWRQLHLWVGLQLGLLLMMVMASGTLATVSHDLDALFDPAQRPVLAPESQVNWGAVHGSLRHHYPHLKLWSISAPDGFRRSVEVVGEVADGGIYRLQLHPSDGRVLGEGGWLNLQRLLRNVHMMLGNGPIGLYLVALSAIPLLLATLAPMFFYRRWWRQLFQPRSERGPRPWWTDWHRSLGVVSLPLSLVVAVTGIWYLAEMLGWDLGFDLNDHPQAVTITDSKPWQQQDLATLLAQHQVDQRQIQAISPPGAEGGHWRLQLATPPWLRSRAHNLYLGGDGQQLHLPPDQLGPLHYWLNMADPLHFGTWGGFASRLLYLLLGLALCAVIAMGAHLTAMRLALRRQRLGRMFWGGQGLLLAVVALWIVEDLQAMATPTAPLLAYPAALPLLLGCGALLLMATLLLPWLWWRRLGC